MKHLVAVIIAASLLCASPFARAVTIDFDTATNIPFTPTETYTEDSFQFTVVSGSAWAINPTPTAGNPASGLVVGYGAAIGIGDTISVVQVGGGVFTFTALDFASAGNLQQSDGVNLIGYVNGVQTSIFPNLNSTQSSFQTLNPLFLTPIDELRIVGASQGARGLLLDNFVFNPVVAGVPETGGTLLLMALALMAVLLTRCLLSKRYAMRAPLASRS
jgi:hypothetical protein